MLISILTLLMLFNLDTMATPKHVTTDQQTTEKLKAIIEHYEPWQYDNRGRLYFTPRINDDDLDII
tara:strand:- start:1145 stop:1342 length:198 start_codon:yes stop_codon:yes gene_type:complete